MARPLMPKATAVWLIENTSLTFEQVADYCGLHALEVQAIADGEVAGGMHGINPVAAGDLTADEIHQLGLSEVARIHEEMKAILKQVGFQGTLQEFFEAMRTDPK